MKVIAMVGVSGSGKTTLSNDLKKSLDDQCLLFEEVTKGELLTYAGLPLSFDAKKASLTALAMYDVARVEYQMLAERRILTDLKNSDKTVIIDKSVLCLLMYVLTVASRYISDHAIDSLVQEVRTHCVDMYSIIVHLPYSGYDIKKDGLTRTFTSRHVLMAQDAVLEKLVERLGTVHYCSWSIERKHRVNRLKQHLMSLGIVEGVSVQ